MKDYKVGVFFEEGAILNINAESPEQAREKAMEILDLYAGVYYPDSYQRPDRQPRRVEAVHRDYMVTDVEVK